MIDMEYNCGFTNDNKWFRYRAAAIIVEPSSLRMDVCFLREML